MGDERKLSEELTSIAESIGGSRGREIYAVRDGLEKLEVLLPTFDGDEGGTCLERLQRAIARLEERAERAEVELAEAKKGWGEENWQRVIDQQSRDLVQITAERDEALSKLDALDTFDGVCALLQSILDRAYPPNTIVCSSDRRADVGAQLTAAARRILELEGENAELRESAKDTNEAWKDRLCKTCIHAEGDWSEVPPESNPCVGDPCAYSPILHECEYAQKGVAELREKLAEAKQREKVHQGLEEVCQRVLMDELYDLCAPASYGFPGRLYWVNLEAMSGHLREHHGEGKCRPEAEYQALLAGLRKARKDDANWPSAGGKVTHYREAIDAIIAEQGEASGGEKWCETCDNNGVVGDIDGGEHDCPDCGASDTDEEAMRGLERIFGEYGGATAPDDLCRDCGVRPRIPGYWTCGEGCPATEPQAPAPDAPEGEQYRWVCRYCEGSGRVCRSEGFHAPPDCCTYNVPYVAWEREDEPKATDGGGYDRPRESPDYSYLDHHDRPAPTESGITPGSPTEAIPGDHAPGTSHTGTGTEPTQDDGRTIKIREIFNGYVVEQYGEETAYIEPESPPDNGLDCEGQAGYDLICALIYTHLNLTPDRYARAQVRACLRPGSKYDPPEDAPLCPNGHKFLERWDDGEYECQDCGAIVRLAQVSTNTESSPNGEKPPEDEQ